MNSLKIIITDFSYDYYRSVKVGNQMHGYYVLHEVTVSKHFLISNHEFSACYQTGVPYEYNDGSDCPYPDLTFYVCGSSEILAVINCLAESDFEKEEYIQEKLKEVTKRCPAIDTIDKLYEVYLTLMENLPRLQDYLDENYTDNLDDYVEDESGSRILTLKTQKEKAQELLDKAEKEDYVKLSNGTLFCSKAYMLCQKTGWGEEDPAHAINFNSHDFWFWTDENLSPCYGLEELLEFCENFDIKI